jgi:serine/threonine protein kinase
MDPDRYELLDVIGSGGMATVWRARDTRLDRLVAIKRPHPAPEGSDSLVRFAREARVAATVSHPNLVAVYDAGTDESGPYLVMELVDGPSLATAPAPPSDPDRMGAEVASALAALHGAGIVHGDVKPGNILLARDGAKLTDFGIARSADDATLTRTGMTFGTPAYAAPETMAHGERSAAADVYSLGAVLYELSTGERWSAEAAGTRAMPVGGSIVALTAALATDPSARPSAAALAARLRNPEKPAPPRAAVAAPTTAMAAGAPPPPVSGVDRPYDPPPDGPTHTQRTALVVFALGALVIAAVVALALRDDDPSTASTATSGVAITTADADAAAATTVTVPASTSPATSQATTVPPTTAPPTTSPPTTSPPTTAPSSTLPPDPGAAIADDITRLVGALTPDQVKPKEAKDISKRVDDAVRAAADGRDDEVEKQLREAAERVDAHVSGDDTRAALRSLLVDLAEQLGVDTEVVTEPFDREDDEDDDDGEDGDD